MDFKFSAPYTSEKILASIPQKIEALSFIAEALYESSVVVRMFDTNVWMAMVGTFMLFYALLYISRNYSVDGQRSVV